MFDESVSGPNQKIVKSQQEIVIPSDPQQLEKSQDDGGEEEEEEQQPSTKKQKSVKLKKELKNPNIQRCGFYIRLKNRNCGIQVRQGMIFCFDHLKIFNNENKLNGSDDNKSNDTLDPDSVTKMVKGKVVKRVPCTIDPSHSVWSNKLIKHLKHCSTLRLKQTEIDKFNNQDYLCLNYNVSDCENLSENNEDNKTGTETEAETDFEAFKQFIGKLLTSYNKIFGSHDKKNELKLNQLSYKKGLDSRFTQLTNQKHILQQSSLIGQLVEHGLFDKKNLYIEFGCGRGELSRYLNKSLLMDDDNIKEDNDNNVRLQCLLVDRESPRLKFDNKMMDEDYKEVYPNDMNKDNYPIVKRLKCDIKDLKLTNALEKFEIYNDNKNEGLEYVGISKHLCGVATDLTLRCLINSIKDTSASNKSFKFKGVLVAMCCRHCCYYNWLLASSKDYLKDNFSIDESNFKYLKKMVSWATNGTNPGLNENEGNEHHFTKLSFNQREIIGLKARRILDESRKFAMIQEGFQVELIKYVEKSISLENNCLLIKKESV